MSTRGCGFPPRRFASTPTPRSGGRPPPDVRRTFGPRLCSSCVASGSWRHRPGETLANDSTQQLPCGRPRSPAGAADRAAARRPGFRRRRLTRLPVGRAGPVHHRAAVPDGHLDRGNTGRRRSPDLTRPHQLLRAALGFTATRLRSPRRPPRTGAGSSTRIDLHPSRTSTAIVRRAFGGKAPGCDEVVGTPGRPGRGGRGCVEDGAGNPSAAAVQFSIVAELTPVPALPVIGRNAGGSSARRQSRQ